MGVVVQGRRSREDGAGTRHKGGGAGAASGREVEGMSLSRATFSECNFSSISPSSPCETGPRQPLNVQVNHIELPAGGHNPAPPRQRETGEARCLNFVLANHSAPSVSWSFC